MKFGVNSIAILSALASLYFFRLGFFGFESSFVPDREGAVGNLFLGLWCAANCLGLVMLKRWALVTTVTIGILFAFEYFVMVTLLLGAASAPAMDSWTSGHVTLGAIFFVIPAFLSIIVVYSLTRLSVANRFKPVSAVPLSVSIVAAIMIVESLGFSIVAKSFATIPIWQVPVSVLIILSALGLLRLKAWGWWGAVGMLMVKIALAIYEYFQTSTKLATMPHQPDVGIDQAYIDKMADALVIPTIAGILMIMTQIFVLFKKQNFFLARN